MFRALPPRALYPPFPHAQGPAPPSTAAWRFLQGGDTGFPAAAWGTPALAWGVERARSSTRRCLPGCPHRPLPKPPRLPQKVGLGRGRTGVAVPGAPTAAAPGPAVRPARRGAARVPERGRLVSPGPRRWQTGSTGVSQLPALRKPRLRRPSLRSARWGRAGPGPTARRLEQGRWSWARTVSGRSPAGAAPASRPAASGDVCAAAAPSLARAPRVLLRQSRWHPWAGRGCEISHSIVLFHAVPRDGYASYSSCPRVPSAL